MTRSLGYVACVTGTPQRATANQTDPTARIGAQGMLFQSHPDTTGVIYIGLEGMDPTTGVGVLAALAAPADPITGPFPSFSPSQPVIPASLNCADYYVSGATGDSVIVSYVQG